jgi:hypothetical protein
MYSDIIIKLRELKQVSERPIEDFVDLRSKIDIQDRIIDELADLARAEGTLLGRTLRFPFADSYSHYMVTGIAKGIVTIEWINYQDGWVDDRLGKKGTLPLSYVEEKLRGEDILRNIFS